MKSVLGVHIVLFVIAAVSAVFGQFEDPDPELPYLVILIALPIAFVIVVLLFGPLAVITDSAAFGYVFWFFNLATFFALSLGMVASVWLAILGNTDRTPFFVLASAVGYLSGLRCVAKIYKWRHAKEL